MKFGLFYQIPVPKPVDSETWDPGQEMRVFHEAIEQIVAADRLGFDYVWIGEHHSTGEYCHTSAPDVLLAALAMRTSRIRLGTAITQVQPDHQHPARLAERYSMVDVLSRGRMELGTGPGTARDLDTSWPGAPAAFADGSIHDRWQEDLHEALRLMTCSPYPGYEGKYFQIPLVDLVPKPVQKPHPPVWYATSKAESVVRSATLGMGVLANTFLGPEQYRERVASYWEVMDEGKLSPIGAAINPGIGVFTFGLCAPTDAEARKRDRNGIDYFTQSLARGQRTHEYLHFNREFRQQVDRGSFKEAIRPVDIASCVIMGSPETMAAGFREYEKAHGDMLVIHQMLGERRHEDIMESLELLATKVFPEFRERQAAHDAWRAPHLERLREKNYIINTTV